MDIYKLIGLSTEHPFKVIKQRIEYIQFQLDPARGINYNHNQYIKQERERINDIKNLMKDEDSKRQYDQIYIKKYNLLDDTNEYKVK